ncbi:MAG: hypothetical protein LPK38_01730 [Actinomycetes bacterium]|nr:hypothetical protein [Actinomycetes bacterium]MDX5380035.1 hypothetical protein [Actinomycetes bacterium]MDX5398582.1 hypothetical protein [Actinomycetes bacterium]MDX5449738.1 hypothetical protein [Actinomycetes bacterium]
MRRMLLVGPMVAAVLLAAGCTSTTPDGGPGTGTPTTSGTPAPSRTLPSGLPSPTALPTGGGTPVTGEVPAALLAEFVADAARRSGVEEADILVVRGESVTWSDGSLGCPQPGMNYTQALVPGYWVVLDADGTEYDYRASARGFFTLCESGGSPPLESRDR